MRDEGKVIFNFPVLWQGWELDSEAWIVEDAIGSRQLIMTNHGREYVAKKSELKAKLKEYREVIESTEHALSLLSCQIKEAL